MKPFNEKSVYDHDFKSMKNKIKMTETEHETILFQINSKMDRKQASPKRPFTQWKYYLALTAASFILIMLALPLIHPSQGEVDKHTEQGVTTEFTLTEAENFAYNKLKEDLTKLHIKELSPISIAKIYVQAKLDLELEVVYTLYTERNDVLTIPKEEILDEKAHPTKEQTLEIFDGIQNGTFMDQGDTGYIMYERRSGEMGYFSMIKDEDGGWSVSFLPIQ
ncbi:hypothetical protein [Sutcliffiella halmapala]|uniref:hypothetical protein n=1 Tax=Sutcliffiella halmapala TaxID=79882 RepID=UPI001F241EC5|nr:hypothetical protein [Sutcliffiella halmapala]